MAVVNNLRKFFFCFVLGLEWGRLHTLDKLELRLILRFIGSESNTTSSPPFLELSLRHFLSQIETRMIT